MERKISLLLLLLISELPSVFLQIDNLVCYQTDRRDGFDACIYRGTPGKKGERGQRGEKGDSSQIAENQIDVIENRFQDMNQTLNEISSKLYVITNQIRNLYSAMEISISNCNDVSRAGYTSSGVYNITVPGITNPVQVYCDLNTDGGGWLVFQRRINGSVDFYRNWTEYQQGFGNLNGEFWLGLDILHAITESGSYQLRVDLEDWDGNTAYAVYRYFFVGNSQSNYSLNVCCYNGNAGNSLSYQNNQQFSTNDRDNDKDSSRHCAQTFHGAWWYNKCHRSNLNGEYFRNGQNNNSGITWYHWKDRYSMKRTEMKIKPN